MVLCTKRRRIQQIPIKVKTRMIQHSATRRPQNRMAFAIEIGLAALVALLLLAGFIRVLPTLIRSPDSYDFAAYYVAARVLNTGEPLYDTARMTDAAKSNGQAIAFPAYIYPPFLAASLRPIANLPVTAAKPLWFGSNLVCLFASLGLLTRLIGLPLRTLIPIGLLALMLPPIYDTLLLGQVNLLLLILICGALYLSSQSESRRQEIVAGFLLGIAAAIKLYPIVIGLAYLSRRRFAALASMIGGILAMLIFGIAAGGGLENTTNYFTKVLLGFAGGTNTPVDQSIWPVMARLFSVNTFDFAFLSTDNHTTALVNPIVNAPIIGSVLALVGAICIIFLTLRSLVRNVQNDQESPALLPEFSLSITLILLTFPVVHDHYLSLLSIPIFFLIWQYRRETRVALKRWIRFVLILLGLFLALQRYWRVIITRTPSPLLLAFGFCALLLLWLALLRLMKTSAHPPSNAPEHQLIHDHA